MEIINKLFLNEKFRFFTKVTLAHFLTYLLCGMFFSAILDYPDHIEIVGMKSMEEIANNGLMLIFAQIIRGILFAIVIWWIKSSIIGTKLAWLKLWVILLIVGIINVYAPTHGSIEGLLYLVPAEPADVPLSLQLSILEVLIQPLLFSIIVTYQRKKKVKSEG